VEDSPVKIVIVLAVILVALSSFPLISQQVSPHEASTSPTRSGQSAMQDASAIAGPAASNVLAPKMDSPARRVDESAPEAKRRERQSLGVHLKHAVSRSSGVANQAVHAESDHAEP
jgi:hypothetical protein